MSIIRSRIPLSDAYMPAQLCGRANEMFSVQKFLEPLKTNQPTAGSLFILGSVGSGKTVVTQFTLLNMPREIKYAYVQLGPNTRTRELTTVIIRTFFPEFLAGMKGISTMLNEFSVRMKDQAFLLILDEFEKPLLKEMEPILHALSRTTWAAIIMISRAWNALENLAVDTKSSLKSRLMSFPPYTENEIKNILEQRVSLSLNPNVVDDAAISAIAKYAAGSGDARMAIQTLRITCDDAELGGITHITEKEVAEAIGVIQEEALERAISDLPLEHRVAIEAIYQVSCQQPAEFRSVTNRWQQLLQKQGLPLMTRWRFYDIIKDLRAHFFVETVKYGRGQGRGFSNVLKLHEDVKTLLKRNQMQTALV